MRDDGRHVLFVCEGSAESAIIETLVESGMLGVPDDRIERDQETDAPYTTRRSGSAVTDAFLNLDYEGGPLRIIRIADSRNERFKLRRGYEERATVETLLTRPEIEILVILREHAYDQWRKSRLSANQYCKQRLDMPDVKRYEFIKQYWSDVDAPCAAIHEYRRIHRFDPGERCLEELLES